LANPVHAKVQDPRILKIESDQPWETDGLKRWTQGQCTTRDELATPVLTMDERVAWAICLSPHESTRQWAINWLSGKDRSAASAWAAWSAAWPASYVALAAAYVAKAWSSAYAAYAALAAEYAANSLCHTFATFEARLLPTLSHAKQILSGSIPADQYDNLPV
jgi:hypothetical protein